MKTKLSEAGGIREGLSALATLEVKNIWISNMNTGPIQLDCRIEKGPQAVNCKRVKSNEYVLSKMTEVSITDDDHFNPMQQHSIYDICLFY